MLELRASAPVKFDVQKHVAGFGIHLTRGQARTMGVHMWDAPGIKNHEDVTSFLHQRGGHNGEDDNGSSANFFKKFHETVHQTKALAKKHGKPWWISVEPSLDHDSEAHDYGMEGDRRGVHRGDMKNLVKHGGKVLGVSDLHKRIRAMPGDLWSGSRGEVAATNYAKAADKYMQKKGTRYPGVGESKFTKPTFEEQAEEWLDENVASLTPHKEMRQFLKKHMKNGWTVIKTKKGHLRLDHPDSDFPVFTSSTPRGNHGTTNTEREMKQVLRRTAEIRAQQQASHESIEDLVDALIEGSIELR